jgi:DNA repair ATPase RecN
MIQKLILHNWQNWKHLEIPLDRITVLVGDNGCGKSAVVRALYWLLLNQWDGEAGAFISWDEDECSISAKVNGHKLARARGKGSNIYTLDDQEYKAFGTTVPQPIVDFLKVHEDNFQHQGDPVFWLSLRKSEAASALNDLFCLSDIDTTLANVGIELRKSNARSQVARERLTQAREEEKKSRWAVEANKVLREMEEVVDRIEEISEELRRIQRRVLEREKLLRQEKVLAQKVEAGEEAIQAGVVLLDLERRLDQAREATRIEERVCEREASLKIKEAKLAKLLKGRCPLCNRQ